MKTKKLLLLTGFLASLGFNYFQPVLAATVCNSFDGWQFACTKERNSPANQIEIFNKSEVGIWLDIDKEMVSFPRSTNYFHKRILLTPGQSEVVEFESTSEQERRLTVLNCATEQDVNDSIRCANHLDVKSL